MAGPRIVDAHHHLWNLDRNYYPWLSDRPEEHFFLGDYGALKKNYLPDDYRRDAAGFDVVATVHCEAEWDREDQVGETRWLSDDGRSAMGCRTRSSGMSGWRGTTASGCSRAMPAIR